MAKAELPRRLLTCLLVMFPLMGTAVADDERKALTLDPAERAVLLEQMRILLEGLQQILRGLGDEDMNVVAQAARPLGVPLKEKIPAATMQKMPEEFQRLANSLHTDFQRIALDAETMKDERHAAGQLSAVMAKCLACHKAYQVKAD
jgi:cytochrome c556